MEVETLHLPIGHFDSLLVYSLIESRFDAQARLRSRVRDEIHDRGAIEERLLARDIDVSRTPVREALAWLGGEGLIEVDKIEQAVHLVHDLAQRTQMRQASSDPRERLAFGRTELMLHEEVAMFKQVRDLLLQPLGLAGCFSRLFGRVSAPLAGGDTPDNRKADGFYWLNWSIEPNKTTLAFCNTCSMKAMKNDCTSSDSRLVWSHFPQNDMQKKENFCFRELSIALVEEDPDQPRKNLEEDIEHLMHSIQSIGMQQPIVVWATNKGSRYIIIDGHRRYKAAVKLGKENIWCRVHENEKMKRGEFEYCRYEIQNNKKEWQPLERANCLNAIKKENSLSSNRELAEFLGLASSTVSYSLRVLDLTVAYMSLMEEFKLTETYRTEYIRIRSKLRKVRDKEISDITRVLFQKARDHVITEAKNFRRLAPIFLRSEQNQEQILSFLNDPDMTIDELEERTRRFAPAVTAEKLIGELARLLEAGEELPKEERKVFVQLQELCKSILSPRRHAAPVLARLSLAA